MWVKTVSDGLLHVLSLCVVLYQADENMTVVVS